MVQRKFGGFLHFLCETSLRLFHVPVLRFKQETPQPLMVTVQPLLTSWAQWGSIFLKALTLTGYFLAFIPKVSGIFQSGTFLLYLMSSQKLPLSI